MPRESEGPPLAGRASGVRCSVALRLGGRSVVRVAGSTRMHRGRERVPNGLRDLAPRLGVPRNALAAAGLELEVLLAGERTERPSVQTGAPLAAAVDMEALPVPGDLTGQDHAGPDAGDQGHAHDRREQSPNHRHLLTSGGRSRHSPARVGRPLTGDAAPWSAPAAPATSPFP